MRKFLISATAIIATSTNAFCIEVSNPADNQAADIRDSFWTSYYAAQNGFDSIPDNTGTEAIINEMRARRGAPPCAIGLLRQAFMNRPAC